MVCENVFGPFSLLFIQRNVSPICSGSAGRPSPMNRPSILPYLGKLLTAIVPSSAGCNVQPSVPFSKSPFCMCVINSGSIFSILLSSRQCNQQKFATHLCNLVLCITREGPLRCTHDRHTPQCFVSHSPRSPR